MDDQHIMVKSMDLRPKRGTKMTSKQHLNTKVKKTTDAQSDNMKGSRSERNVSKTEADFDYLLAKKYGKRSNNEQNLYFEKHSYYHGTTVGFVTLTQSVKSTSKTFAVYSCGS